MPLPDPDFIARDPAAITAAMIAYYEEAAGRPLYPAQVERLLVDLIAYRETLTRIAVQEACKQNLVAFANYPMLDFLGELVGCTRLPAAAAVGTLRFTRTTTATLLTIPAGTRAAGQGIVLATNADLTLAIGEATGDVAATAIAAGAAANGLPPGAIRNLVDPVVNGLSVQNIDTLTGGLDGETDERLRQRIQLAPEHFAIAGPREAYRYHALSVSPAIVAVGITNPQPGRVYVYPLTVSGLPNQTLLDDVRAALSADAVRPLTDWVEVSAPTPIPYDVTAVITPFTSASAAAVLAAVQAEATAYAAELALTLGIDLVPSRWIERLSAVPGVYRVDLTAPTYQVLAPGDWPTVDQITLTLATAQDG